MKLGLTAILSFVIIIVNAQFGLQIAIYEIFKPSIIESFCINKDIENSDCEAMCHMNKMAQEDQDSEQKTTPKDHEVQIKLFDQIADFLVEKQQNSFTNNDESNFLSYQSEILEQTIPQIIPPPRA